MKRIWAAVGPAIIVAAVVLGPGSILTSSKVGATFGLAGLPVILGATVLMIGMVALSARLGAVYPKSLAEELAGRLGRPVAIAIGGVLFTLVALFQSSNNLAVVGGLEPLVGDEPLPLGLRTLVLLTINGIAIAGLYGLRDLYRSIERLMKVLVALMVVAFLINFAVAMSLPGPTGHPVPSGERDWIPLLGMIGTTFSVGGAFYQAYLVREKGWGTGEVGKGTMDAVVSISVLGAVTCVVLMTGWRAFYGRPDVTLSSVGDVARQMEPLFGSAAKGIFCAGIFAGAFSSFLGNALIGGTVLSDSLGKGARLEHRWPLHLTSVALGVGMVVALASMAREGSTVHLITLAQALTVLGIPALALALLYLGTRRELTGDRAVPRPVLVLSAVGLIVACGLAALTAQKVLAKWGG